MLSFIQKRTCPTSTRLSLVCWLLVHLILIKTSCAQAISANSTSEEQDSYRALTRIFDECDWRLLEVKTEPNEPNQLLPLALSRNHGPFIDLFRQESLPSLKADFKDHRLFFSAQSFSQARLNPKLSSKLFTYALCEFPKRSLDIFSTQAEHANTASLRSREDSLQPYFLVSSHPFTAYLNGQLIDQSHPHKKAPLRIRISQLLKVKAKSHSKRKNQLLLRFHPLRSQIIWGLSTNPNQISALKQNLDFHLRIKHETEASSPRPNDYPLDKKQSRQNPHQTFVNKKKTPDYRKLESTISHLGASCSNSSKETDFIDQADWRLQAWSIIQAKPHLDQTHTLPNYEIQSIQSFYLPYSMLNDDLEYLKERLVKLKNHLELGTEHTPFQSSSPTRLKQLGFKQYVRNVHYTINQKGINFRIKQSFQWARPLWSLHWRLLPKESVKSTCQDVIILVNDRLDQLGQWSSEGMQRSRTNTQDTFWCKTSFSSLSTTVKAPRSLAWSVFTDDSELVNMYEPILNALSQRKSSHHSQDQQSRLSSEIEVKTPYKSIETLTDLDSYLRSSTHLHVLKAYYEERPSGLVWEKEKIPTQKKSLSEWALWLNRQLQIQFRDYPNPILTNHPLSAEYKLHQELRQSSTHKAYSSRQPILWSPASKKQLLNRLPLQYWGILKEAKLSQKKPIIKALNQYDLPHGSDYLSFIQSSDTSVKRKQKAWPSLNLELEVSVDLDPYKQNQLWLNWQLKPMLNFRKFSHIFSLPLSMSQPFSENRFNLEEWIESALADQVLDDLTSNIQLQYADSTWWPKHTWSIVQISQNQDQQAQQLINQWKKRLKKNTNKLRINQKGQSLIITQQIKMSDRFIPLLKLAAFDSNSPSTLKSLMINRNIKMDSSLFALLCRSKSTANPKPNSALTLKSGHGLYYRNQWLQTPSRELDQVNSIELRTQFRLQTKDRPYRQIYQSAQSPQQAHKEAQLGMLKELEVSLCEPGLREQSGDTQAQR